MDGSSFSGQNDPKGQPTAPEGMEARRSVLVIAMALMGSPRLLLLDEPSLGLSPVMVRAVFDVVERMHRDLGMTVVVAEQTVPRLLKIATDVCVLSRGGVAMHAAPAAVDEAALQRVYLS